jgi:serine/threonine protein kinase/tetratricopeptide (TPR) repeat protein
LEKLKIGDFTFVSESGRTHTHAVLRGFRDSDRASVLGYFLPADLLGHDEAAKKFLRDTHILAQKEHPGILRPLAAGKHKSSLFVVYPDAGAPLSTFDTSGRVKPKEVLSIASQILQALLFAESKEIACHGYMSPDNIYFNLADGRARLALFGVAPAAVLKDPACLQRFKEYLPPGTAFGEFESQHDATETESDAPREIDVDSLPLNVAHDGAVFSTDFDAPDNSESFEVFKEADAAQTESATEAPRWRLGPATDLYGLGLVMLELLTGEKHSDYIGPEESNNPDILAATLSKLEYVPIPVQEILLRLLTIDPDARHRDYKHAAEEVGALLGDDGGKISFDSFIYSTLFGGRFKLGKEVCRGAYARILTAEDTAADNAACLVKIIDLREYPQLAEYFRAYLKQMSTLEDPVLVKVHDVGVHYELGYIAMEDAGQSLEDLLVRRGMLPLHDAAHITMQIAKALEILYFNNVPVYGGLKPTNIFLSTNLKEVKLADVFLSKLILEKGNLANTSAEYFSYDWVKSGQVTRASDFYCLGLVFFELLVGHPPYSFKIEDDIIHDHLNGDTFRVVHESMIGAEAKQIIYRLLDRNPGAQYKSAEEIKNDIAAMMGWDKKEKIEIPHIRFDFADVCIVGKNTKEKVEETLCYRLPTKGDRPRGFMCLVHGVGNELGEASAAARLALDVIKEEFFTPGHDPTNPADLLGTDPEAYMSKMFAKANQNVYRFAFRKGKLGKIGVSTTCCFIQNNTVFLCRSGESTEYYFYKGEYAELESVKGAVVESRIIGSSDTSLDEEPADMLGMAERFRIHTTKKRLRDGEQVILLSKTLRDKFSIAEIREFITSQENPAISVELIEKNARRRRIEGTLSAVLVNFGEIARFVEDSSHKTTGSLARSYMESADQLLRDGKVDDAINLYQRAIEHNPNYTILHYKLGRAFLAKGLEERALGSFLSAISLDQRHIPASIAAANVYIGVKKYSNARDILSGLVSKGVEDPDVYAHLALVLNRLRRSREAADYCQRALRLKPGHPLATQEMVNATRGKLF